MEKKKQQAMQSFRLAAIVDFFHSSQINLLMMY